MPYYAQIGLSGKVVGVSELAGEIDRPDYIPIDSLDVNLLGAYYIDGQFEAVELSVDKPIIKADGIDAAKITAVMPSNFTEAIFRRKNGEIIAAVPVVNKKATFEVTSADAGKIIIKVETKRIKVIAE